MIEVVAFAGATVAGITLALVALILRRLSRLGLAEPLTRPLLAQLLREEAEAARRAGDDQARGVRQDLAEGLRGAQATTVSSFGSLSEGVNAVLRDFGERLDRGLSTVERRVGAMGEKLDHDIARMGEAAERGREALRRGIEGRLDAASSRRAEADKGLREELGLSFHRLGGTLAGALSEMGEQQRERLERTAAALAGLGEKHERSGEALRLAVEGRLDHLRRENATKLDEMRQTVDEKLQSTLETRLGESFNRVVEQLNRVHEGLGEMKTLASNVGDLKNVLTNVKVRGTFGEVQLGALLDQFLTPEQYVRDARVKEHTAERVEFAVKMPGGVGEPVLLPIDAKFPRETYDRLLDAAQAGDEDEVRRQRKLLEAQVRACAKEICAKYVNPPATTDFAILFLPTEGLYAEVLRQVGVFECLQREHRVTLAGPTTLSAILNALQMGFRSVAIERRSGEVWKVLGAVQTEFGKYNAVVERLGKQLSTAAQSVDSLGVRTRAMNRRLREVEAQPEGAGTKALLGFDGEEVGALGVEPVIASTGEALEPIRASGAVAGTA